MKYKGALLHFPKMIKANAVKLQVHIWSQIQNYEDLPQLMTNIQASHAQVFKSMEVIVHTHAIPSLGTLTQVNTKKKVQQELDSCFDELMHTAISPNLPISANIMCKYVVGLATLNTMMSTLTHELEKEPK